jgi:alkanesulfonate monooxygenase SsuD/methylene tetrahydromethanopterin reductase-like flavin-dependent oxidoreductase (luciferase family)
MLASECNDVRIGLLLPSREQVLVDRADVGSLLEIGRAAERLGFDSLWAGDSLLARPRVEPLALLCALAGQTESVTLGTAVLVASLRHPLLLAHQVATLDQIAEGRLILGLGAGFPYPATEAEFAAVGVPFSERVGRLIETVKICRLLWQDRAGGAEQAVTFEGRYTQLHDVTLSIKPHRAGGPALWLAGEGDRGLDHAGSVYDGWLPYSPTPELYAQRLARVQAAAADADRRDIPTPALYVTVALDDDRERAGAALDDYVQRYYGFPLEVMGQLQAFYGGTIDGCVQWLDSYVAAGARHIVVRIGQVDGHMDALERFAEIAVRARAGLSHPASTGASA